ncbi:hypothetical protein V8E55_008815 [Tylopilus felleus]
MPALRGQACRTVEYSSAHEAEHLLQDAYCYKALAKQWDRPGEFPEDLKWEALVDILRGKVKGTCIVQRIVQRLGTSSDRLQLSNEIQFLSWLSHSTIPTKFTLFQPSLTDPMTIPLLRCLHRLPGTSVKRTAIAPRILHDEGTSIKVVVKSHHPSIQSRWLLHEARQAHYYGLPANTALASVTPNAAGPLGLDYRLGYIKAGYDAGKSLLAISISDLAIWDSHPLALGATPVQVFIDGIPQLEAFRFLSWFILGENIPTEMHEDVRSALRLYKAYQESEERGVFDDKLEELVVLCWEGTQLETTVDDADGNVPHAVDRTRDLVPVDAALTNPDTWDADVVRCALNAAAAAYFAASDVL